MKRSDYFKKLNLLESQDDDFDDYDDFDEEEEDIDFEEYAEERLPYEARCKEYYMDPDDAGKLLVNLGVGGQCDLLWASQGDCDFDDFVTLMNCFGEYYPEETNGKTYTAVMMCRSYPGYGNIYERKVSFKNGKPKIEEPEDRECYNEELNLRIIYDEDDEEFLFELSAPDDGITATGKTIEQVKYEFERELEDGSRLGWYYFDISRGYEFGYVEIKLDDFDKSDAYSAIEYANEFCNNEAINIDKFIDDLLQKDGDIIAEGEYSVYEQAIDY